MMLQPSWLKGGLLMIPDLCRHNNVEAPMERAGLRHLPERQGHNHGAASLRVTDAVEDPVTCVEGLALNVHLCDQASLPRHMHGKVDVGRPPWIRYRADRAEPVSALIVHLGAAIALEGMVDATLPGCTGMAVDAIRITLPDLDHTAGLRLPAGVQHPP